MTYETKNSINKRTVSNELFAGDASFVIERLLALGELNRFKNDYLVETFRIWDCYAQDWLDGSPVLLRFETDDVVVLMGSEESFEVIEGPVNTFDLSALNTSADAENDCLCWLRDSTFGAPH